MDLHKIIHDALHEFIQTYIPDADLSTLDDVLLSYITGVLEDLGSQESVEENFDVEVFAEMLEAYIPGFAEIDSVKVCEMMFSLASKLATARDSGTDPCQVCAHCPMSEWEVQEQHLLEMFPKCTVSEARNALSIAKGDMEEAVRLIIEGDVQLSPTPLNEDNKTHRPVAPKDAPKKLVRYHDNQVVTTKGERYQLVKKNETEEMKKTYVNLKPARKYRFH
uniref:CUE domain containing 2 n=1 Tax=Periophthalmus magnuspinnatus TaxID=409849 RepID=A0A3B4AS54_9GOBI